MIENKGLLFILCNINDVKLKTSSIVVLSGLQKYDTTELLTICYYGASYSSKKYFFLLKILQQVGARVTLPQIPLFWLRANQLFDYP